MGWRALSTFGLLLVSPAVLAIKVVDIPTGPSLCAKQLESVKKTPLALPHALNDDPESAHPLFSPASGFNFEIQTAENGLKSLLVQRAADLSPTFTHATAHGLAYLTVPIQLGEGYILTGLHSDPVQRITTTEALKSYVKDFNFDAFGWGLASPGQVHIDFETRVSRTADNRQSRVVLSYANAVFLGVAPQLRGIEKAIFHADFEQGQLKEGSLMFQSVMGLRSVEFLIDGSGKFTSVEISELGESATSVVGSVVFNREFKHHFEGNGPKRRQLAAAAVKQIIASVQANETLQFMDLVENRF